MYECPLCGKDSNRRGEPFTDPDRVASHITGSHDETHRDVRGEDMLEQIEATAATDGGTATAPAGSGVTVDPDPSPPADGSDDDPHKLEFTQDEFDKVVDGIRSEGYEDGRTDAQSQPSPTGDESTVQGTEPAENASSGTKLDLSVLHDEDGGGAGGSFEPVCPDCGREDWYPAGHVLENTENADEWLTQVLREYDRVCVECGVVYDSDGEPAPDPPKRGGGGWGKWLIGGGVALAGLAAAALGNGQQQQNVNQWDRW